MSAAARRWLSRLNVGGASQRLVLAVLADAADKNGRVNLSQTVIAQRSAQGERTVRRALDAIESAGLIRREHRSAGGKTGRIADLIHLSMEDIVMVQPANLAANKLGASGQNDRLQSWVQPANLAVAPTNSADLENATKSMPRARADVYTTSPDKIQPQTSGRVWFEKTRGTWRARVRFDSFDFDIGRFPTEAEAASALEGALADIIHACTHRSGEPREPEPKRHSLDVAGLGAAWPDTFSDEWREKYSLRNLVDARDREIADAPPLESDDGVSS